MRYLLLVSCLAMLLLANPGLAQSPCADRGSVKGDGHVGLNPGKPDGREGGETVADALVIPGLPFLDAGNTSDNIHDYDEVCPYTGSTSPDVVYAFSPTVDLDIELSLCSNNNEYDTKIYLYQDTVTPGSPWACNDDFCSNDWTFYVSFLEGVTVHAGHTYFVVVDGYGGDSGNYELEVTTWTPCVVECPPAAVPEGEPPLVDYYEDMYNGGCCGGGGGFQALDWVNAEDGCAWMCGVSGWYYSGGSYRDTDWFLVFAAGDQIDMTVTAEYSTNLFFIYPPDCLNMAVVANATASPCVPTTLSYPTDPGMEIWLWTGPDTFNGPVYEYTYFLHVCGTLYQAVPTEKTSWGAVKEMFR